MSVAINMIDYKKKMNDILNDTSTYTIVNKNPIKNLKTNLITILKRRDTVVNTFLKHNHSLKTYEAPLPKKFFIQELLSLMKIPHYLL